MKEIVVMSGKGGTGKTSITAAIGALAGQDAVVADCDVDAANLHLLYEPQITEQYDFKSGKTATMDYSMCNNCGECQDKCRFDAIQYQDNQYVINEINCEGCAVCSYFCPSEAISMIENDTGNWYKSKSRFANWFIHAKLGIGEENSGKLVSKVKEEAKKIAENENIPFVIVDGPPGIGCPVISAVSGASIILIVTEATASGLHDLKRLVELIQYFKIQSTCIINKYDLNRQISDEIDSFCNQNGIPVLNKIPYHHIFFESLQNKKTVIETKEIPIKKQIKDIWYQLKEME